MSHPKTLLEAPTTWGSHPTICDETQMESNRKELVKAGFDKSVSLSECSEYSLVAEVGDCGLYNTGTRRNPGYRLYRPDGYGHYDFVTEIFAASDSEAIAEAKDYLS